MRDFLGIDGCRGGWVGLAWEPVADRVTCSIAAEWRDLALSDAQAAAVDMPVGLTDIGSRDCDLAARRLLPPGRKSSVFPAPRRYMLDCATWREAQDQGLAREGKGLSKQAWNIIPKIREIDRAIAPGDQDRIFEAHPELIFLNLSGGQALPPKRTPAGLAKRLVLLEDAGLLGLRGHFGRYPAKLAGKDDIIDAAACALAARRIYEGRATCLPEIPRVDARGLRMEIWF